MIQIIGHLRKTFCKNVLFIILKYAGFQYHFGSELLIFSYSYPLSNFDKGLDEIIDEKIEIEILKGAAAASSYALFKKYFTYPHKEVFSSLSIAKKNDVKIFEFYAQNFEKMSFKRQLIKHCYNNDTAIITKAFQQHLSLNETCDFILESYGLSISDNYNDYYNYFFNKCLAKACCYTNVPLVRFLVKKWANLTGNAVRNIFITRNYTILSVLYDLKVYFKITREIAYLSFRNDDAHMLAYCLNQNFTTIHELIKFEKKYVNMHVFKWITHFEKKYGHINSFEKVYPFNTIIFFESICNSFGNFKIVRNPKPQIVLFA